MTCSVYVTPTFIKGNKRKNMPSKGAYKKLNCSPPRHNEEPVEVLGRYALRVVLPHVYKVFLNWLRTPEKNSRLLIKTDLMKEQLTCKQLVPSYFTGAIFTSTSRCDRVFFALPNSDWRWKHVTPLSFHQRCCSLVGEPHSGRFWTCSAVRPADACWCCWDTPPCGLGWPETVGVSGSLTVELQKKRNTDTVPRINSIKSSYIISLFPPTGVAMQKAGPACSVHA